ncbi:hypothetical protein KIN20_023337, partial [Parelaphostrongylus tenuis]
MVVQKKDNNATNNVSLNRNMNATIHPSASFDEQRAAESLERAMRGFGTDKKKVVDVLVGCNNAQRQMPSSRGLLTNSSVATVGEQRVSAASSSPIRTPYKVRYGKDLENELRRELSGELEDVIVALMQTPTKRDVLDIQKAVKGFGTNEKVLIEIFASRSNEEIRAIREQCDVFVSLSKTTYLTLLAIVFKSRGNTFYTTYDKSLEDTLWSETSGDFRRLLQILVQGNRDESSTGYFGKAVQ